MILWSAWNSEPGGRWLWAAGFVGAFLTAIYIFRAVFIVFFGEMQTKPGSTYGWRMVVPPSTMARQRRAVLVTTFSVLPKPGECAGMQQALRPARSPSLRSPSSHDPRLLIIVPVIGGVLAWLGERVRSDPARWISLAALVTELILVAIIWRQAGNSTWLAQTNWPWIPQLGIAFRLDLDGLSLVLILLTLCLGILAVAVSWREITEHVGFFHLNLLFTFAGVVGVFLALDLFLFFFFWELMLVPMYFIIAIWGHEQRILHRSDSSSLPRAAGC
jgi:NADH:ubiquinone oxidoreductase subunit 5 (subunit L)/multisubunit Na+/H+ antiporter MnhA subunit